MSEEQPPSEKTERRRDRREAPASDADRERAPRATRPRRRAAEIEARGAGATREPPADLDAAPTQRRAGAARGDRGSSRGAAARSRLGRRRLAAHAVDRREPAVRRRQAADAQAPRRAARRDRAGARARGRRRRRAGATRAAAFSCTRSPAAISSAPTPRTRRGCRSCWRKAGAPDARADRDARHLLLSPAGDAPGDRRDPRRRLGRHAQDAARPLAHAHPRQEGGAGPAASSTAPPRSSSSSSTCAT